MCGKVLSGSLSMGRVSFFVVCITKEKGMTHSLRSMILKWLPVKAPSVTTLESIWITLKVHSDNPVVKAFDEKSLKALALNLAYDLEELYSDANQEEALR